jgi:uncharacterized protein YyaL (SSP411 family)
VPNRLAAEPSPYLLQHAENPVDWYPWGEEAFVRARDRGRPIFLSIGYSTCHWCHVMEHESFESDEIAAVLNERFVPIKVDREERPDVDRVYMAFVQATTGAGGWPMSVWLTPDLKPFYGGTYFPPSARWGRPGFIEILQEIDRTWQESRDKLAASADGVIERLRDIQTGRQQAGGRIPDEATLEAGVREYAQVFDHHGGGFGDAPKFPRPAELLFLLREYARTGAADARHMVLETLRPMALGGMRDHVGGGFHRYSVDAAWRVPHFEKMLYDQAQLVLACLEAAQAVADPSFAAVADDTLAYVRRELTHPEGGFCSAEDADSVPPEHAGDADAPRTEGAFYVWSQAEIDRLFGDDADVVRIRYGINADGNAPQDPHGEFAGKNLLYVARPVAEVVEETGRTPEAVQAVLDGTRSRLFDARATRPRPHLDDKVLSGWNGLTIAAFSRAVRMSPLDQPARGAALDTAVRAATFLRERLWDPKRSRLLRRWRDGRANIDAYGEDYASVVWGLLELFQASSDPIWLDWASELQAVQTALFWDEADGGWYSTTGDDPTVLLRMKEDYDGAEPSVSALTAGNLLTWAHLGGAGAAEAADRLERTLARVAATPQAARVMPLLMASVSVYRAGVPQIVVVGERSDPGAVALHQVVTGMYLPGAVTLVVEPGAKQAALAERLPWVAALERQDGRATAYLCRQFMCETPVTEPQALADQFEALIAHRDEEVQ